MAFLKPIKRFKKSLCPFIITLFKIYNEETTVLHTKLEESQFDYYSILFLVFQNLPLFYFILYKLSDRNLFLSSVYLK